MRAPGRTWGESPKGPPEGRAATRQAPVLITGFEPFDGDVVNPSGQVAEALQGRVIAGHAVQGLVLPCRFGASRAVLLQALERLQPVLVVALGQAARAEISVERVALNVDDARIPDNAGARPIDRPIVDGGPAAYFSTLPIKAITQTLQRAGLPAQVSQTAGTFVCNHVFYGLLHALAQVPRGVGAAGVRGGFIHLPLLPEQAALRGGFQLPLPVMVEAVRLAVLEALRVHADVAVSGGSIG